MTLPICAKCVEGSILPGEPKGSMQYNETAYFAPAPEGHTTKSAVVLLTDIFGLPLVNCKIMADSFAKEVECDVWVPDLFNGSPPAGLDDMNFLPGRPGERMSWVGSLKPGQGAQRTEDFIRKIKSDRGYEKIGVTGYCYGGSLAILLGATDLIQSAVVNHPGMCTLDQIKAMRVPTSWQCAEEDQAFKPALRMAAEAEFKEREGEPHFVNYEFTDYPGTVHGFAARPNMAIPEAKEGFEKAFAGAVAWFKKTLF